MLNIKSRVKDNLIVIVFLLLIFLSLGMYFYALKNQSVGKVRTFPGGSSVVVRSSPIYAIPLTDDRVLIGASHNVVVGRVLSQIGTRKQGIGGGRTFPISQFSVQVLLNIKGKLSGTVTLEQGGGYQDGALMVTEDGDTFGPSTGPGEGYLMQPGSTYLLSTRYESDGVYYLWDFPTASKLISEDSSLSDSQLQSLAQNDSRVQELQAAYPHEILVADDVRTGNTRNSYVSTHTPPPALPAPPPAPSSTEEINPPVISNLTSVIASTSVTISWTTNKPATSDLLFGSSTAMLANVSPDTALVTSHSRYVYGLGPNTVYYFEVRSKDISGKITSSAQQSFTTLGASNSVQSSGGN
jgi:hypothetical protein